MSLLIWVGRGYDFTDVGIKIGGTGVISSDAAFSVLLLICWVLFLRLLGVTCRDQGDGILLHVCLIVALCDAVYTVDQNDSSDGGIQAAVLPLFCQCFSEACEGRDGLLNELNMSSFIQTMQSGLMTHDKQEAAGAFLLSAINDQEYVGLNGYRTDNLGSKKISRLVSRLDPVPDVIKQASMKTGGDR